MPDKKITELSPIVTISSGDVFPIVDISDNTTKKIDITQIKAQSPVQSVNSNIGVVVLTKTDIGLSNVDNTSDANKPVSTATQTALDGKVDENAAITGATKTKITYDAKGLVTSGADATTADIADSTNKRYVTDAQSTVIGNTSGTNSGNQTLANTSDSTSHTVTLSSTGGSVQLVEGSGITLTTTGTTADGIITIASTGGGSGTVTNVSALTLGTTGTDLSSTVANSTTTPVITLNVPNASAANRGALTSTDWSTFNGKQATLVSGTSIKTVNSTSLLGSGDVAVQATLVSGTNIKTINSTSILGSGNLVVAAAPSGVSGAVQFSDGTALSSDATKFFWDNTNKRLGIGTNAPLYPLHISSGTTFTEVDIEATGVSARAFFRTQVNAADTYFDIRANGTTSPSSTYAGVNMQGGNVLLSSPRDAGLMIINNSAKPIMFAVSATEVMRLDTNYYMGIGINAPTSRLHVKGIGTTSGTSSLNVTDSSSNSILSVRDDGFVGIGTTTPTEKLMIVGNTTGSVTTLIRNTNAGGDSRLTLKNDLSGAVGVQVTGSTYFGAASSYFFTQGGLAAMGFSTDGDLAAGGSGIITFATGGYSASQERMRILANGNIAINVFSTYAASARLQIDSTTQGFLMPRMTTTQRDAIATPATGLSIYNTTTNSVNYYNGTAWEDTKLVVTNRQTASYTLVIGDANKLVEMNVATANNLTIPLDATVAYSIGTQILISQYGAGQTTVVATGGVTIRSSGGKLKLNVQYSGATLIKIATNEWYCFGDLSA